MVIKWSHFAKSNLQEFIKSSKLSSPKLYVENLIRNVYLLEDHPKAGKILFIDKNIETRQFIHKSHRILYRIVKNEIHIGAVIHTNQNLETSLKFIKTFFD